MSSSETLGFLHVFSYLACKTRFSLFILLWTVFDVLFTSFLCLILLSVATVTVCSSNPKNICLKTWKQTATTATTTKKISLCQMVYFLCETPGNKLDKTQLSGWKIKTLVDESFVSPLGIFSKIIMTCSLYSIPYIQVLSYYNRCGNRIGLHFYYLHYLCVHVLQKLGDRFKSISGEDTGFFFFFKAMIVTWSVRDPISV